MNWKNDKTLRIIVCLSVMNLAMVLSPKGLIYALIGVYIICIVEFVQKYKKHETWVIEVILTIGMIIPTFIALTGVVYFQWSWILELKLLGVGFIFGI